jgi:hypothetical protein
VAGVSDERRDLDTAGRLGYRHNAVAEDLAAKRRSTVDLYQLDFRNEVFTDAATLMLPDSRLRGLVPSVPLVYVATSRAGWRETTACTRTTMPAAQAVTKYLLDLGTAASLMSPVPTRVTNGVAGDTGRRSACATTSPTRSSPLRFGGKGFCCSQDQAGSNLRTLRERSSTMLPTHFPIGYSEATSGSLSTAS